MRACDSADTKASEEGWGGGAPGTRAETRLQPTVKTMVMQFAPPADNGVPQWSRYPSCSRKTSRQSRWMGPEGSCDPVEPVLKNSILTAPQKAVQITKAIYELEVSKSYKAGCYTRD
ncbi:hypothetical protein llap_5650 [Limosa lapponica baueri]|uniref:Uncharacterized protein n=1 Tax=Limosa lapponica baueri TaxID=1758121 RepID=A0A2I0UDC8_LIMLA|nr:hypothetical protein llap_5650 [Limosa lapponica baueri]